jgi:hypothetical protein
MSVDYLDSDTYQNLPPLNEDISIQYIEQCNGDLGKISSFHEHFYQIESLWVRYMADYEGLIPPIEFLEQEVNSLNPIFFHNGAQDLIRYHFAMHMYRIGNVEDTNQLLKTVEDKLMLTLFQSEVLFIAESYEGVDVTQYLNALYIQCERDFPPSAKREMVLKKILSLMQNDTK